MNRSNTPTRTISIILLSAITIAAIVHAHTAPTHTVRTPSFHHRREIWKSQPAVSEVLIRKVNTKNNSTWIAGENPHFIGMSLHDAALLCGVSPHWMESYDHSPNPLLPNAEEIFGDEEADPLPENYDVRERWGETCPIVLDVTDQGACGSCWAVSAAAAMSDRNCIMSNGTYNSYASSTDILACCGYACGSCQGGQPDTAWSYWMQQGTVTGGHYGSNQGCWPYQIQPCRHGPSGRLPECSGEASGVTPYCTRQCTGGDVDDWNSDKRYGNSGYRVGAGRKVEAIQQELFKRGSIQATFYIYSDFLNYRSGVYSVMGGEMLGGHAVKLLGWGVDEATSTPYWLLANSWNEDWGENGFFKIRRGTNEAQIEDLLFAGIPQIPAPPSPPQKDHSTIVDTLMTSPTLQEKVAELVEEVVKEIVETIES